MTILNSKQKTRKCFIAFPKKSPGDSCNLQILKMWKAVITRVPFEITKQKSIMRVLICPVKDYAETIFPLIFATIITYHFLFTFLTEFV